MYPVISFLVLNCCEDMIFNAYYFRPVVLNTDSTLQILAWGASIVAQLVKPSPVVPASHVGAGSSSSCPTSDQLPANRPGKAAEGDLSTWASATHV